MKFKVGYTPKQITTKRPFYGTGWPVRHPSRKSIVERFEYRRQKYLWIVCTQLGRGYKPSDQKRIIQEWCEFFREESPLRELALRSRVSPKLFEGVCQNHRLTRLHAKWGPVVDLVPLERLQELEGLYLGTTSVQDISPIAKLPKLKYLQLTNLKRVVDFSALADAPSLEFLSLEGWWPGPTCIHVKNLNFLRSLTGLRALSLFCTIIDDFDLSPLLELRKLEYLELTPPIKPRDRERLLSALPNLRYGNVVKPNKI